MEPLLLILERFNKPVAIIDEYGGLTLPQQLPGQHRFKIFCPAGVSAGRKVGQYLIGHGHRRCAFFSIGHEGAWSQNRLHGLRLAFDNVGGGDTVSAFVSDFIASDAVQADSAQHKFMQQTTKKFKQFFPYSHFHSLIQLEYVFNFRTSEEYLFETVLWNRFFPDALRDA